MATNRVFKQKKFSIFYNLFVINLFFKIIANYIRKKFIEIKRNFF